MVGLELIDFFLEGRIMRGGGGGGVDFITWLGFVDEDWEFFLQWSSSNTTNT